MPNNVVTVTATYKPAGGGTPGPTAPRITGPVSLNLTVGYDATSTGEYTITGTTPVKVEIISGDAKIVWNNTTKKLDIAAGLPIGVYPVELRATNSAGQFTFNFTLTVEAKVYYLDRPATVTGGTIIVKTPNANPYLAVAGDVITLTLIPDDGYVLESVYVYDSNNPAVTIPLSGTGNTRTFTMPASHVTIVVTFRQTVGVETVQAAGLKAFVQDGTLFVSSPNAVSVYNTTGTLMTTPVASEGGEFSVPLPGRGIYIVVSGTQRVKVVY
jgi:hypothetical protein